MDALIQYSGLSPSRFEDQEGIVEYAKTLAPKQQALSYGKALDIIFDKHVKQNLIQPTFVMNPPREISPLAKASKTNPEEAERFELVMAGMEIANAYSELNDPDLQAQRFRDQVRARQDGDDEAHRGCR